jgi:SAM-dependent methyltransferase
LPALYDGLQSVLGAYEWRRKLVLERVVPKLPRGGAVLDIGCGTAAILDSLPASVHYVGYDRNERYINIARSRYRNRNAVFFCEDFKGVASQRSGRFHAILALGLIHHLDDDEVTTLFQSAKDVMNEDGVLVTSDPLLTPDQSFIARYLVSRDRGKNVRTEREYLQLAKANFAMVEAIVDKNPLRIPYSGMSLLCS